MMDLTLLIAPIFLIILLGNILRRILIVDDDVWDYINKMAYWVLFPCLLFNKTSVIDFADFDLGPLSITVVAGFIAAVLFSYIFGKISGFAPATLTSVIQGGGRHNAFLALATASQIYGEEGAMIAAIIIAILVTFTNLVVNITLTIMLSPKGSGISSVISDLKRNPFIIAILLGAAFNVLGLGNLPILHEFTLSVGETTLTIALLCVGAGLRMRGLSDKIVACAIATFAKMIIFPSVVYMMTVYFALPHVMAMTAMIFAISPTGAASYPLAKQMGGDAPLMASLISLQTLISVITLPLMIILLGSGT
ncbi:MAG: AEC family transporter [Kordiimonadaceae bacterium]|jgi:malonate transporter and related proteins|nr:AEC family transporter [Kordiimonadaceae bacterium]MBT6032542.1 AEC family transporter [Kordiimonadaceae bacterium]MBT6328982.1 AEC family transporter [Kordiimonadaceae bacterium]